MEEEVLGVADDAV